MIPLSDLVDEFRDLCSKGSDPVTRRDMLKAIQDTPAVCTDPRYEYRTTTSGAMRLFPAEDYLREMAAVCRRPRKATNRIVDLEGEPRKLADDSWGCTIRDTDPLLVKPGQLVRVVRKDGGYRIQRITRVAESFVTSAGFDVVCEVEGR